MGRWKWQFTCKSLNGRPEPRRAFILCPRRRPLSANTAYTVSVTTGTDSTHAYADNENTLASTGNNGAHLTYPANAGVYTTTLGTLPTTVWQASNYLRDIVFAPSSAVAPAITTQPANATVTAGQTATFTVAASGTAPLAYQWQKNFTNISGATSASYTTPATVSGDNGATFRVVVSNSAGSITSNSATLTVNVPNQAPVIVSAAWATPNPVTLPSTAGVGVAASDDGLPNPPATLTYTWSQVSGPGTTTFSPNGTAASANSTATFSAAGTYTLRVTVSDSALSVTSNATVTVLPKPDVPPTVSLTSPANNATFTAPANITITANAADSDGTVTKVDFYNGATLLGSATASPYSFTWSNVAAGTYSLTAKATDNAGASTTSAAISITVVAPPPPPPPPGTLPSPGSIRILARSAWPVARAIQTASSQ